MKKSFAVKIIAAGLVVVGILSLYLWMSPPCFLAKARRGAGLAERLPLPELPPQLSAKAEAGGAGEFIQLDGVPSKLSGAWPRFRGANFDAISKEEVKLARSWPAEGPGVLWTISVGDGFAGAAVLAGRVYILDYDRDKQADTIRCLSLDDGKDIWRYSYPVKVKRNHGMSRTVPAVTDKYIVTLGPKCHVTCLDSMTGQFHWMMDLVRDFKAEVPPWYSGQCPLIDDGKAIIAVGGDVLLMAVDCKTGEVVWRSPNPHRWVMTHSSIMPAEFNGKRMYVYCASGGVVGVSAEDGAILWETPDPLRRNAASWTIRVANIPSPVVIGDGLIFLSGGYNSGSMMLQLVKEGDRIVPREVFRLAPEVFGSGQHTPIFYNGYIYGVRPDGQLACLDLNGKIVWTSTSVHRFGLGPYTIANGLFYVMNDSGVLTLAEATPAGYHQLAQAKVLDGPDSWGPMAVASGRLILRDLTRMICLDITEK